MCFLSIKNGSNRVINWLQVFLKVQQQGDRKNFRTPRTYCDAKLHYSKKLREMLNLIHSKPQFVLERLFEIAFLQYNELGHLPLDCNSQKKKKSVLGIIRCELDSLPEGDAELPDNLKQSLEGKIYNSYLLWKY